jgi:hypothetical protein
VPIFVSHICALVNHKAWAACSANCPSPTPCRVRPQLGCLFKTLLGGAS